MRRWSATSTSRTKRSRSIASCQALEPVKRLRLRHPRCLPRQSLHQDDEAHRSRTRSIGRGLAKIELASTDTLIAFAAKAGAIANDGDGANSPFATALINYIATPGLDLRIAFGRVRDEVLQITGNRQEPFVNGSLGGDTVALVPQAAVPADARCGGAAGVRIHSADRHQGGVGVVPRGAPGRPLRRLSRGRQFGQAGSRRAGEQAGRRGATQAPRSRPRAGRQDFRSQLEEQAAKQAEETKKRLTEQAKSDLDEERRKVAESSQREVDEARKQADEAQAPGR